MRAIALILLLGACAPFEHQQDSCINHHVGANYGTVREVPGGFEITGSGPIYQPLEVTPTSPRILKDAGRYMPGGHGDSSWLPGDSKQYRCVLKKGV